MKDLLSGKVGTCHRGRLKFFRKKDYEISEEGRNHLACHEKELLGVENVGGIRNGEATLETLVKWKNFEKHENDWVTIESLIEDVSVLKKKYIEELKS